MLRKLLKYEIKATSRIFLPMYALLIVFALINKFFMAVNSTYLEIPRAIALSVFFIIIIGICVMTLIVTIQRFNKNLLTDEGYLSFTLPVKVHSHIDSKMIVTLMWSVLSVLVSMISIFVMAVNETTISGIQKFLNDFMTAFNQLGSGGYILILEAVLLIIFGILVWTLDIYAAITVGNMSSKHKLLAGVGAYIGFGVIQEIIASIIMSVYDGKITRYFDSLEKAGMSGQTQVVEIVMLMLLIYTIIVGVAFYFFTEWMLRKKLNLE